ncbi:RNI-like protein [Lichtheimia hyalospora FSU 10163]|nr:RNI-like protein [Lichtheimia hyalospora FSU 10163]
MQCQKSILKAPPSTASNGTTASWFARIHSKLYTPDDVPILPRRDLKRVTFSVSKLTTEHVFGESDDDSNQLDNSMEEPEPNVDSVLTLKENHCRELPKYYEWACRLREEQPLDRFMDVLRSCCFSQLTTVDLSNQTIDSRQMGPIADILMMECGSLELLDLSNCGLEDMSLRVLLHSLLINDRLPELRLSHNTIESDGFKYIAIFISQSKAITTLDLSWCAVDRRAVRYLSRGIELAQSLQDLYMDHCSLKPNAIEILATGVRQSKSLRHLSLRHNRLSSQKATDAWIATMLDRPVLDDDEIRDMQQRRIWPSRCGLQRLDLTGNYLQGGLATMLGEALSMNHTLSHLVLNDCQISDNECAILADALLHNHNLRILDLADNPITLRSDQGILSMKTALAKNHFLHELNLAGTGLDSSAAITLAECLPENSTLSRLDLTRNPHIDMAGVLALSISIKMNHTLTFLDINIPAGDHELAQLQHDIVSACTENMQRAFEMGPERRNADHFEDEGPGSSSSSYTSSPRSQQVDVNQGYTTKGIHQQEPEPSNLSISSYMLDEIPV